jgi:hypothetical protein
MSGLTFFVAVYAVGLCWALPARNRLGPGFCCAVAYPFGLLLWVLGSIALVWSPFRYSAASAAAGWGMLMVAGVLATALAVRRGARFSGRDLGTLAAGTALFACAAALASRWNLSIWSNDSHVIVSMGRSIAHYGEIAPAIGRELASRDVFQVMVQGASVFVGLPYLYAAPPLLGACFLVLFAQLGARALAHSHTPNAATWSLVGLTTCAMGTTYFFLVHYLYLHENFAAAVFLFLFAACFWIAEREHEPAWLPFAFSFLLAFSLDRVEGPLIAVLFLLIAHSQSRLPARALDGWVIAYAVAVEVWYAALLHYMGDGGGVLRNRPHVLDPDRAGLIMGAVAAACTAALVLRAPRLAALRCRVPQLIAGTLAIGVVAALAIDGDKMWKSGRALHKNMTDGSWGGTWYVLLGLGLLVPALPRVGFHQVFTYGCVALLAFIYLLSFFRAPYAVRWSDTGHRMLISGVPLLYFYLLLGWGHVTLRGWREPSVGAVINRARRADGGSGRLRGRRR